jgi:hypothetical protein
MFFYNMGHVTRMRQIQLHQFRRDRCLRQESPGGQQRRTAGPSKKEECH